MRIVAILLALIISVFAQAKDSPASVNASAKSVFKEGEHYVRLPTPVRTADSEKIEVAEVFWYGCGHCYAFEPQLQQWRKTLPEDVLFIESPAMWRKNMETHARIFYTSKALGVLDVMHGAVFDAMHIKKLKLERTEEIQSLYAQQGISGDDFEKTFNSFGVTSSVKRADARARGYGITGTPEMVIDGTYRISSKQAGSQTAMLAVAEYLICKISAEKKNSKTHADSPEQGSLAAFCADYTQ